MINSSVLKSRVFWVILIGSLAIILGITYLLTGSSGFPDAFPNALVAWGTLILGIATFMLVISVRQQENLRRIDALEREERGREDDLAKENRDRTERYLNEIIDWAIDVRRIATGDISSMMGLKDTDLYITLQMRIVNVENSSEYLLFIAKVLGNDLANSIAKTRSKLRSATIACIAVLDMRPAPKVTTKEVKDFTNLMVESNKLAGAVIKIASDIKISLLSQSRSIGSIKLEQSD